VKASEKHPTQMRRVADELCETVEAAIYDLLILVDFLVGSIAVALKDAPYNMFRLGLSCAQPDIAIVSPTTVWITPKPHVAYFVTSRINYSNNPVRSTVKICSRNNTSGGYDRNLREQVFLNLGFQLIPRYKTLMIVFSSNACRFSIVSSPSDSLWFTCAVSHR